MSQLGPRTGTAEPGPAQALAHEATCYGTATVPTARLFFQPFCLQNGCSDVTTFPSPLPSLMHYLPLGTPGLNEFSSSQLSKVQDMLSMEKRRTPEKQKSERLPGCRL